MYGRPPATPQPGSGGPQQPGLPPAPQAAAAHQPGQAPAARASGPHQPGQSPAPQAGGPHHPGQPPAQQVAGPHHQQGLPPEGSHQPGQPAAASQQPAGPQQPGQSPAGPGNAPAPPQQPAPQQARPAAPHADPTQAIPAQAMPIAPEAHPQAGPTPPGPMPPAYRPPANSPDQQSGAAQQAAAMPMQRTADGPPTGTPWSQPPQRPTSPPPAAPPHPAGAQPVPPGPGQPGPGPGHAGQPGYPGQPAHAGHPGQPPAQDQRDPAQGEIAPGVVEVPQQGAYRMPTPSTPPATANPRAAEWTPDAGVPTADDFARRRAMRPPDPIASSGMRAMLNKTSMGLVKLPPGAHERSRRQEIETVRRNFGGLRQVTVVNPKGGAGKTVAILLLAMTFGQNRGGYVLAWDNNETQGTLGMRASQDFHNRTVRDLLRDLAQFRTAQGRVGDLSQYVRAQGEGMFDVLASDESATAGEMLTAAAFAHIRDVVSRFYKLIFVDTGNNVRAQNWQAAIDATAQLVVTMSARNDSAETAARMLDHLEQTGRHRLVRQAVTVVSMPPSRR
ncbi:MAG TPA: chromosome partitioning protein, partial [Asanoa sp.]|nr:chromosome partitioning protein [Asanoa sp.]